MSADRRSPRPTPPPGEAGMVVILFAGLLVVLLGMAAILVDLGQQRASRRQAQAVADMSALGGGKNLSLDNPGQACQDVITYFNTNAPNLTTAISASSFCNQMAPVPITATACSGGTGQAKPQATVGRYTVQVVYPVLDSEMVDPNYTGAGKRDGTACERMAVKVTVTDSTYFGRVLGSPSTTTTRTAVVKKSNTSKTIPSLWLLDPTGCVALSVTGGAQVVVGDTTASPPIPGFVTIDSDGSTCNNNQTTLDAGGSGTYLRAVPTTGTDPGVISLFALPPKATTCSGNACDPSDVSSGQIAPQPQPIAERATRSPVDWRYNCKSAPGILTYAYPLYHGIVVPDCDRGTPAYIDQLVATVGTSGAPGNFTQYNNCNPSGTVTLTGNTWVNCATFSIGNGTNVTFTGNVVFQGTVKMTGGSLRVIPGAGTLSSTCLAGIDTACINTWSPDAAFVYQRPGGSLDVTGGAVTFRNTFLYQASGAVKNTGGSAPVWSPPAEGPFTRLSLWSEKSDAYTINGGGGLDLTGVFFTPEADPFKITGGGGVQQQRAQFIAYHLTVSGSGQLIMAPDQRDIPIPPRAGLLIR